MEPGLQIPPQRHGVFFAVLLIKDILPKFLYLKKIFKHLRLCSLLLLCKVTNLLLIVRLCESTEKSHRDTHLMIFTRRPDIVVCQIGKGSISLNQQKFQSASPHEQAHLEPLKTKCKGIAWNVGQDRNKGFSSEVWGGQCLQMNTLGRHYQAKARKLGQPGDQHIWGHMSASKTSRGSPCPLRPATRSSTVSCVGKNSVHPTVNGQFVKDGERRGL